MSTSIASVSWYQKDVFLRPGSRGSVEYIDAQGNQRRLSVDVTVPGRYCMVQVVLVTDVRGIRNSRTCHFTEDQFRRLEEGLEGSGQSRAS